MTTGDVLTNGEVPLKKVRPRLLKHSILRLSPFVIFHTTSEDTPLARNVPVVMRHPRLS